MLLRSSFALLLLVAAVLARDEDPTREDATSTLQTQAAISGDEGAGEEKEGIGAVAVGCKKIGTRADPRCSKGCDVELTSTWLVSNRDHLQYLTLASSQSSHTVALFQSVRASSNPSSLFFRFLPFGSAPTRPSARINAFRSLTLLPTQSGCSRRQIVSRHPIQKSVRWPRAPPRKVPPRRALRRVRKMTANQH